MRTVTLAALLLAACGAEPLEIRIPLKPGTTHLDMQETPPLRRYQYRLEVTSRVKKQVELEARLEEPAPEGVVARLGGTTTIPREGIGWPWLVVIVPEKPGEFRGAVSITSPEVPGWSMRYTFDGRVVAGPREGRRLVVRPAGVNLGTLRPGEETAFAVALSCVGSEDVTIRAWTSSDPERVRIPPLQDPVVIKSGGEYQLLGAVLAPRAAGPFEASVRVESDAEDFQRGIFVVGVHGTVAPDYAPHPPRAVETAAYPIQETELKLRIRAREGVPPFRVAEAKGHERHLDVVSLGTAEPAAEQLVTLKLRRDAPTDAARPAEFQVRFRLEPGDVEVAWPVRMLLYPPVHASPREINFGRVPPGAGKDAEILLTALPNRVFKVTGATSERRVVRVSLPDHAPGTVWRVLVSLPKGLEPGFVEDRVVIETDDPDVPRVIVPVRAEVR